LPGGLGTVLDFPAAEQDAHDDDESHLLAVLSVLNVYGITAETLGKSRNTSIHDFSCAIYIRCQHEYGNQRSSDRKRHNWE
jgi:hypothetical protein